MKDQNSTKCASDGDGRLRYDNSHWAREEDQQKALDAYLELGDTTYNRTKLRLFMDMAGDLRGKKVLDFGGGAGILAVPSAMAGADVTVIDAESNALQTARFYAAQRSVADRLHTVQAISVPPELQDASFDIVVAKDIVEHLPDDNAVLAELASCVKKGGILLLSTHNNRSLNYLIEGSYQKYWCKNSNWLGWDITHVRFYTTASIRQKLERAGFRAERWASVYLVPYNILSWLFLLRRNVELPSLHLLDLSLGRHYPFNRLGWNVIVRATRK